MLYQPESTGYREILPGILMKTLTHGAKTLLCEFRINKGAQIPLHQHPHEQSGYLVSGSLRLFGDEGETIVTSGCGWTFNGGVMHGAEALEDTVAIEVFSPVREEYLNL